MRKHAKAQETQELIQEKTQQIRSFRAKMEQKRSFIDRLADKITAIFGSIWFFVAHFVWFILWILANLNLLPEITAFDPYPFGLLTMIVSLEAIFLSIFVLISQNRAAFIADLREEIDLQINVKAQQEITRVLSMVDEIHDHLGLNPEDDDELREMKKRVDIEEIEIEISREINGKGN